MVGGRLPLTGKWWRFSVTNGLTNATLLTPTTATTSSNGAASFIYSFSASTISASNYFLAVTNTAGSVTSAVATLTIMTSPVITNQPSGLVTNSGAAVFFTVGVSGSPPFSYQWFFNGSSLGTNGSANPLELDNVSTNAAGGYQVIVANPVGSVTSMVANLTVDGSPAIITQPQNQTVVQGTNATFVVVAGGADPLSYQWWYNSTNYLPDATNSSYAVVAAQPADAGGDPLVLAHDFGAV